jgi:putative hydrolase of the HAD superfamily
MIAAVLFDLYETLITESGSHPTRASTLAMRLGLEESAYRPEWRKRRPSIVRGEVSLADALSDISRSLNGRADPATIQGICDQRVEEKADAYARVDNHVAALVTALVRRGIRLAVVSNGFTEDVVGWPGCPLAPHFECNVFSCAERVSKPDPEIYLRAIHRFGVEAAAAVYIGDGADNELAGAEQAGIRAGRAAWFVPRAPQSGTWPEFTACQHVLGFVAAG